MTLAFEIVARDVNPPAVAAACCADLANAAGAMGMVAGQTADFEAEGNGIVGVEQLEAIHLTKDRTPAARRHSRWGDESPGPARKPLPTWTNTVESVGLAFQIIDDLLDIVGEQEKMGKGVRKDAKLGKLTYPALLGVEESRERARALIAQACCAVAAFGEAEAAFGSAGALRTGERPLINFEIPARN